MIINGDLSLRGLKGYLSLKIKSMKKILEVTNNSTIIMIWQEQNLNALRHPNNKYLIRAEVKYRLLAKVEE